MGSKSKEPDRSGVVKLKRNEYEVRPSPQVTMVPPSKNDMAMITASRLLIPRAQWRHR